jgi:hypothetical protein
MTFDELADLMERHSSKSFGWEESGTEINTASAQLGTKLVECLTSFST